MFLHRGPDLLALNHYEQGPVSRPSFKMIVMYNKELYQLKTDISTDLTRAADSAAALLERLRHEPTTANEWLTIAPIIEVLVKSSARASAQLMELSKKCTHDI